MEEPPKPQKIWKILKWTVVAILILVILTISFFVYRLSQKDLYGWRLNFNLSQVKTHTYQSLGPTLYFLYPRTFELDINKDNRYGKNYMVGIKLLTDDRTGCDIRRGGPAVDLSKTDQALVDEIAGPIRSKASDFQLIEGKKIGLGGEDAFKMSFSFLDPIGARIRLDQLFVPEGGMNYMIICGTGEYQYAFFQKDFQLFYDSMRFTDKVVAPKKWWQELFFWK